MYRLTTDLYDYTQMCPLCHREVGCDYASESAHMDMYHADIVAQKRPDTSSLLRWAVK